MTTIGPIQCIVPPHMLEEIAKRGDDRMKAWALRTLSVSAQFRGERQVLGALAAGAPPAGTQRRALYGAGRVPGLPGKLVPCEGGPASPDPAAHPAVEGT